jgi:1-deoxy-D-xylulose-5-phosphate synthase
VVAITAAMKEGTGLAGYAEAFPERFYDVGIAEPHAVTFAAGLATQGLRPVVAVYSTFLQRAYDQIVHDVCLQKLPVVFAVDRAGIVGEDGATHQGLFDVSLLRTVPNLVLMAPKDTDELKAMLSFALSQKSPAALRYPRGKMRKDSGTNGTLPVIELGKAEVIRQGDDLAILALGNTVHRALVAADRLEGQGLRVSVVNPRFVKPLDELLVLSLAERCRRIVTVEENVLAGGFGAAVLECLSAAGLTDVAVRRIGIDDVYVEHGSQSTLRKKYGLDEEAICRVARGLIEASPHRPAFRAL